MTIQQGDPSENGLYVAYVDPRLDIPFADKKLMVYLDGEWSHMGSPEKYRGTVYGWIGPLPAMRLED